jgi:iron complex outermembrane receptor protein
LLAAITPNGKTDRFFDQKTKSYAAFLSLGFKVTDDLRLAAGGRYTKETKDVFTGTTVLNNPAIVLLAPTKRSADFTDFSPRLGVDYQITRDIFAYVSGAKGFKSGGFNGGAALTQALDPVNPEKVWSYEGGLKTQWLEHRVTFNVAGFYMDYRDIQEQVFAPRTDGQPGVASLVLNAARAHIKGVEMETAITPVPMLTLSGDLGYTDARYAGRFFNGVADLTHNKLPFTPKWTGRVNAHLAYDLAGNVRGGLDVSYSYRSRTFYDATNTMAIAQPGYGLLDARTTLTFDNGFQLAAFGKNLTNRVYQQNGVDFVSSLGFDIAYFGAPRTYGVELSWKY